MDQIDLQEIKQKTTHNLLFLTLRNFGIQGVSFLGFFLLTLLLGRAEVGLFAIVAESIGILGYFSDIGLAGALIQKKGKVTTEELRTTFFIQQLLVLSSLTVLAILYPSVSHNLNFGDKEKWILISLCFSFIAASLKTIPSVLLERNLNFRLISTVDIIENISFYLVAVIFAYLGFGAYSYVYATFFRSILGLTIIYFFNPWSIGFSFSINAVKSLFKYGIPFQFNSFIAMAKDRLSYLLVARIIGAESFGILSWAQKGPRMPLSMMDAIMRVTFPTFSRLQDHKEILKKSLEKSIYFIALFVFPCLMGISLIAPDIINIIPKYTKWAPAITPLYFYAASAAIAAVTTPLTNAFNAIGKISITTRFMIMWTILTWFFYPLLSYKYGYLGTSIAALIVGLSSIIVWITAKNILGINVFKTVIHPVIATLIIFILAYLFQLTTDQPFILLSGKIVIGMSVYTIYNYIFSKKEISWFFQQIKNLKNVKS